MVEAEEVRAHLRATRSETNRDNPDVMRARMTQALSALRRQLDVVEPKLEQLKQLRTELRERIAAVETRLEELDKTEPATAKS